MKMALKVLALALLVVVVLAGGYAAYVAIVGIPRFEPGHLQVKVEVTPAKVEQGRKYVRILCAGCHMDPTTRQLTGKRLADLPPQFGVVYSKNITRDPEKGIGGWTDGELIYFLRTGIDRHGQYVPPYMIKLPLMADEDLEAIVAFLRSDDPMMAPLAVDPPGRSRPSFLAKLLSHTVFRPLPYPRRRIEKPTPGDRVAYGRYLSSSLGCFSCHSADFKTMNELEPEKSAGYMGGGNALRDLDGGTIVSANITFDAATGIGKWSEADFTRAVRTGVRPDRTVLRYPMLPIPELDETDTAALYAYLATVPKIANPVARQAESLPPGDASAGKRLYYRYGCVSCHSTTGVGIADLRHAVEHYPTDERLAAWIRNAPAVKPGTQMPTFQGVIGEDEYPDLVAYVKELGVKR